ncbi:TadE/TadG family type IV pilus assembly protein [Adlercreutzia sp. ZJ154]|uniref:TadE/TadG family type IV pilus assembly protein n=1 Tax=Adlercreutzia sp. ZJ154 TaxID=2709790 RepID=UPI0013ECE736|nr:TadE/TadG family type IV pilus assembly protein [Adlercreutzia sp. ZJ154]
MFSVSDKCKGQATVEAAFALPILMLLALLLLQPSIVLYDRIVMQNAAAEGCRLLATSSSADSQICEDFIRRRLSAVPQVDIFHVHSSGCSWDIGLQGLDGSSIAKVTITNQIRPLPLLDAGASLLGLVNASGNLEVHVECEQQTQPDWAIASMDGSSPQDMVGEWF